MTRETHWYYGFLKNDAGTLEATANLKNFFGFADKVSLSVERGLTHSNVYSLSGLIPRILGLPYSVEVKAQQLFDDKSNWSSYVERLRGGVVSVSRWVEFHDIVIILTGPLLSRWHES